MNNWEILGIEPTNDIEIIKSAYARKSKIYHPETNPIEFQQLHMAYKNTISLLRNPYYTQPEYKVIQERSLNSKRQITLESIPELMNPEDSSHLVLMIYFLQTWNSLKELTMQPKSIMTLFLRSMDLIH